MHQGFNITDIDEFHHSPDFDNLREQGKQLYDNHKRLIRPKLMEFIVGNEYIDAGKIKQNWFPTEIGIRAMHVFISHSHKDESLALALAGLLSRLGLNVFIDSCIWGYSDDLLKEIDNLNCVKSNNKDGSTTYSYEKRNASTSHVHMMLANALTTMMDQTECVMFLNTHNSINVNFNEEIENKTYSPWIFYEIAMTKFLKARDKDTFRYKSFNESLAMDSMPIAHDIDLSHLINIPCSEICSSVEFYTKKNDSAYLFLNQLYLFKEFDRIKKKR